MTYDSTNIKVSIPDSEVYEETYKFRLQAQEGNNTPINSADITLNKINCNYAFEFNAINV
jgi:hypothetical protein